MTESFSGFVSIDDDKPVITHVHKPINDNLEDPRICMVKEYLSKCPDATLQDIKKKALLHFSKPSEKELKEIIKFISSEKYNEFYSQITPITTDNKTFTPVATNYTKTLTKEEIEFLEQHRHSDYKSNEIYNKYKTLFSNSIRKPRFVSDYYAHHPEEQPTIRHTTDQTRYISKNHHILTQTIKSLYKAGFTPEMLPKIKPIINELLAQNSNQEEIELAIEYMKP